MQNQAFVFAKGSLEDAGFAWRVLGSVRGYAANTVVAQSPAAGTRVLDTGAPLITLTLKRNGSYPQSGQAEDASPYAGTVLAPADLAAAVGPAHAAPTNARRRGDAEDRGATPKTAATPAKTTATRDAREGEAAPPRRRRRHVAAEPPVAFVVPGARKEPLDEMPLPNRAQLLEQLARGAPEADGANVKHWLYQNEWIVAGAKFGWWRGAEALTTLIAVDRRAQQLWGIGSKSALQAQSALTEVQSKTQ